MKNKNVGASFARPKRNITNKTKLIIGVAIILLLLIVLILNKNKLYKTQQLATNEYTVSINNTTIDISNVITAEPNVPVLGAGMIPIKWNEENKMWEITSKDNWYDYSKGIPATMMLSDRLL